MTIESSTAEKWRKFMEASDAPARPARGGAHARRKPRKVVKFVGSWDIDPEPVAILWTGVAVLQVLTLALIHG